MKQKKEFNIILIKQSDFEEEIVKKFLTNYSKKKNIILNLKASFDLKLDESSIIPGITGKKIGLIRINKFLNQLKEKEVDTSDYIILSITNDILETYKKNKLFPQEISYGVFYYNDNLIFSNSIKKELDPKIYLEYINNQDQYEKNEILNFFVNRIKKPKVRNFEDLELKEVLKEEIERVNDCLEKGFNEVYKVLNFFELI